MCTAPPVYSARRRSRETMTSSATPGQPGSPRRVATSPSCTTPPATSVGSSQWSITGRSKIFEYSRARRISPADATGFPSSENPRAPATAMSPISASSTPFLTLGHAADRVDRHRPVLLRLGQNELDDRARVDGRLRVRHAGDAGEASRGGGAGSGRDRLLPLVPGLAQVDVHVDEARDRRTTPARSRTVAAGGVDSLPDAGDAAVFDEDVVRSVDPGRRIDEPSVLEQQLHGPLPPAGRARPCARRSPLRT